MAAAPPLTTQQRMAPLQPVAPTGRWIIFLPGPSEYGSICANPGLGNGHQSTAHIVIELPNGPNQRSLVRKVRKSRYTDERIMDRADREVRIGTEIERRIGLNRFGTRPNIAKFIAALDVPTDNTRSYWMRTTFWELYNMGSTLKLRDFYTDFGTLPPPYVLARFLRQGLEVISWLMHPELYGMVDTPSIFHEDMHAGNIFVHWHIEADGPHFHVGDFGFARLEDEPRPMRAQELAEMSPLARQMMTSPRDSTSSPAPSSSLAIDGGPAGQEWDVSQFYQAFRTTEDSLLARYNPNYDTDDWQAPPVPPLLQAFLNELSTMNDRDSEAAHAGGPRRREPYQDLRNIIGRIRAYEDAEKANHDLAAAAPYNLDRVNQAAIYAAHLVQANESQKIIESNSEPEAEALALTAGIAHPLRVLNVLASLEVNQAVQRELAESVAPDPYRSPPRSDRSSPPSFYRGGSGDRVSGVDSSPSPQAPYSSPRLPRLPPIPAAVYHTPHGPRVMLQVPGGSPMDYEFASSSSPEVYPESPTTQGVRGSRRQRSAQPFPRESTPYYGPYRPGA